MVDNIQRSIISYLQDTEGQWVARLVCGHPQHVRHDPPLIHRDWVLTQEGRRAHLGTPLHCVRCEAFELPTGVTATRKTAIFTEITMPAGLRQDHVTDMGIWARIEVLEGRLRYCVPSREKDNVLSPGSPGIVIPEIPHFVEPLGAVRFQVEFLT